jgi:hypothetical protein
VTVVNHRWRQQPDAGMSVRRVVPGEERVAERAGLLDAAEPFVEVGPILQRLELRLGERMRGYSLTASNRTIGTSRRALSQSATPTVST